MHLKTDEGAGSCNTENTKDTAGHDVVAEGWGKGAKGLGPN